MHRGLRAPLELLPSPNEFQRGNVEEQPRGELLVAPSGDSYFWQVSKADTSLPFELARGVSLLLNGSLQRPSQTPMTKRHQMLARRAERMCKYIFKCVLVCCFSPGLSFSLPPPLRGS